MGNLTELHFKPPLDNDAIPSDNYFDTSKLCASNRQADDTTQTTQTARLTDMKRSKKYDSLKLENQVCFPLYACSKELVSQYAPYLKKIGLTYTQYIVMMVMWEHESVSSRDLAAKLHLDYGTLTPVLKKLESIGYLTRQRDPEDERLLILTITDKGAELKDEALKIPPCIASCVGLSEDEFKMLYILTYKALSNMENAKCNK